MPDFHPITHRGETGDNGVTWEQVRSLVTPIGDWRDSISWCFVLVACGRASLTACLWDLLGPTVGCQVTISRLFHAEQGQIWSSKDLYQPSRAAGMPRRANMVE